MFERIKALFRPDPLLADPRLNANLRRALAGDSPPTRLTGLDLGQAVDFAAIASVQRREIPLVKEEDLPGDIPDETLRLAKKRKQPKKPEAIYTCDYLHQWPNGTPYTEIISEVEDLFAQEEWKDTPLAVDYSGLGRPVVDFMRMTSLARLLRPVNITGGMQTTDGYLGAKNVPKRTLATTLLLLLNSKRLLIGKELTWAKALKKQFATFTHKIKAQGDAISETWEAMKEKDHDDLVLALALAVWCGEGGGKIKFNCLC